MMNYTSKDLFQIINLVNCLYILTFIILFIGNIRVPKNRRSLVVKDSMIFFIAHGIYFILTGVAASSENLFMISMTGYLAPILMYLNLRISNNFNDSKFSQNENFVLLKVISPAAIGFIFGFYQIDYLKSFSFIHNTMFSSQSLPILISVFFCIKESLTKFLHSRDTVYSYSLITQLLYGFSGVYFVLYRTDTAHNLYGYGSFIIVSFSAYICTVVTILEDFYSKKIIKVSSKSLNVEPLDIQILCETIIRSGHKVNIDKVLNGAISFQININKLRFYQFLFELRENNQVLKLDHTEIKNKDFHAYFTSKNLNSIDIEKSESDNFLFYKTSNYFVLRVPSKFVELYDNLHPLKIEAVDLS